MFKWEVLERKKSQRLEDECYEFSWTREFGVSNLTQSMFMEFVLKFKVTCHTVKANSKNSLISELLSPKSVALEA